MYFIILKKTALRLIKTTLLTTTDEQGFYELLGEDKSWIEFSKMTHIGWRGPMILWSNLNKLEKVYRL